MLAFACAAACACAADTGPPVAGAACDGPSVACCCAVAGGGSMAAATAAVASKSCRLRVTALVTCMTRCLPTALWMCQM